MRLSIGVGQQCKTDMDHKQSITQAQPIRLPFSLTNSDLKRLLPPPRTCHQIPIPFSPPKPFLSPETKKLTSERMICGSEVKGGAQLGRERKMGALFTIEENYYSRKNQNLVSPRPPKYKPPTTRPTSNNDPDPSDRVRERKVIFTEGLVRQERSTSSHRQSLTAKPIIRNIVSSGHHNQDNLSNSSRSLSVQNSFVSQFRSLPKRQRPKVDSNKQRFTQIMSHFQRKKEMREQRNKNKFSRQAREKTLEKEEQYIDTIFPPVYTSIFINPNKVSRSLGAEIKWKRLSQIFEDAVVLNKEGISQARVVVRQQSNTSQFVATAFNAVKHCSCILQKIFEEQTFNRHGLYLVRIFQQHNWKSIILDEYVPILNSQTDTLFPAFIDVEMEEGATMQIWPFLLEKAYSYYYSAYELLKFGNTIDFMNEIMGMAPLQIPLKKRSQKEYTNLQASLQSVDSVAIGEIDHKKQIIIRVKYSNEGAELVYSEAPSYRQHILTHEIFSKVNRLFLYSPKIYHSLSTNTIGKYSPTHHNHDRSEYSIRKLILTQSSDCLISVQQKQSRFFVKSSLNYQYMWIRVLLVQREFDGYRWIQGKYSNSKSITLGPSLSQGEYYLIIMPQWKQTQNFQLTLLVWANHHVNIERERGSCEQMVEQACMDLAQRKGKMNQLTPTLCSYNYVCPKTGMIIENINNQKLKEEVKVSRDISGIPSNVKLLPINKDFWPEKGKMITQIQVAIPKLSHYTIVLKMRGGVDQKLIQMFASEKQGKEINIK